MEGGVRLTRTGVRQEVRMTGVGLGGRGKWAFVVHMSFLSWVRCRRRRILGAASGLVQSSSQGFSISGAQLKLSTQKVTRRDVDVCTFPSGTHPVHSGHDRLFLLHFTAINTRSLERK